MLRFWCSSLQTPWSWQWRAYPGVWAAVAALVVPYLLAQRRRGPSADAQRRTRSFLAGAAVFWLASDWPLGVLGAGYLAAAHMAQFMLYTVAAAPLLVLGIPEWMARRIVERLRIYRLLGRLSHAVTAAVVFNLCLVATHSPWATDTLRSGQLGSFVMDVVWLASGVLVWLPVISPLHEHRIRSYPAKMAYLFLALGVVPAVPAGFLTFASFPLYAVFELAPRFYGLDATTDQQIAGLIMKLGGIPVTWGAIGVMMARWAEQSRRAGPPLAPEPPPGNGKRPPPPSAARTTDSAAAQQPHLGASASGPQSAGSAVPPESAAGPVQRPDHRDGQQRA